MFLPLHDRNPVKHIRLAYVNYALIGVTCLVYLAQSVMPPATFDSFAISFGMIPVVVRDLVPAPVAWLPDEATLVTYAFLHGDWMHLLSNMLFLFIFGDNIEDAMGHVRYLVFYGVCAVLAGFAHLLVFAGDYAPLIGASGAVAGVMGAYALLYPNARVFVLARIVIPIPLPIPAFWMLGVWLGMQLFYALTAADAGIAWWAHIGGLAAGGLLALVMKRRHVPLFGG